MMKLKTPQLLTALCTLGFAATLIASQEPPAEFGILSDLLEEGIYLQEVKSDPVAAIKTFKRILENEAAAREIAAEVLYHLALCYGSEGDLASKESVLNRLLATYPEQSAWVNLAKAELPQGFLPSNIPWSNGERIGYDWMLAVGKVIGRSFSTYTLVENAGRSLWELESRMFLSGNRYTSVVFDAESFQTVSSVMATDVTGLLSAQFHPDHVEVAYGKTGSSRKYELASAAYDNEQAMALMRQFPAEVGFRTKENVFVNFSGMALDIVFEVTEIKSLETILGEVECYRVDLEVAGMKQSIYITNDAHRYPVYIEAGGIKATAVSIDRLQPNTTTEYLDAEWGYAFTYPSEWAMIEPPELGVEKGTQVVLLEPDSYGSFNFFAQPNSILSPNELGNPEQILTNIMNDVSSQVEGYALVEGSKKPFLIEGMKAFSVEADFIFDGTPMRYMLIVAMNEDFHYAFHGRLSKATFAAFAPTYRAIAGSLRGN